VPAGLVLDPGEAGRTIDIEGTLEAMDVATVPDRIAGAWVPISTRVSRGEAISLFTSLKRRTESGLILFSTGIQRFVDPERLAGWISARPVGGELVVEFDEEEIHRHVEREFFGYVQGELSPTYDIVEGRPVPVAIDDSRMLCCTPAIVDAVKDTALGDRHGPIEVPLRPTTVDEQARDLDALGIREVVGEFTTFHRCCESRVTNIHRIADLTRGVLIEPGGVFSVNGFVGRRTTANGFVDGGVIYQGRFESDVGGGISQYATTLFNAAFFAGLDFIDYQSHSIYLSRYPYGREATLSYPEPDLIIRNSGPYAVLIWPTYDNTSVTVTLYSTPTATVSQTDQVVDRWRSCTRVTTHRLREYEDGESVEDFVFALYRPSAGYSCDGLPEPAPPGEGETAGDTDDP